MNHQCLLGFYVILYIYIYKIYLQPSVSAKTSSQDSFARFGMLRGVVLHLWLPHSKAEPMSRQISPNWWWSRASPPPLNLFSFLHVHTPPSKESTAVLRWATQKKQWNQSGRSIQKERYCLFCSKLAFPHLHSTQNLWFTTIISRESLKIKVDKAYSSYVYINQYSPRRICKSQANYLSYYSSPTLSLHRS